MPLQGLFPFTNSTKGAKQGTQERWDTREVKIHLLDEDLGGCIIRRIEETETESSLCQE